MPAAIDTTSAKTRTVASTPRPSTRGKSAGNNAGSERWSTSVRARPAMPPVTPSVQTFNQQLPRHARAAGAEGRANRDLARPARGARQLQARDIGGRRQQQQPDGHQQHEQGPPDVGGQRFAERLRGNRDWTVAAEDGRGRHAGIGGETAPSRAFRGCLSRGDARAERGDGAEHRQVVAGCRPNRVRDDGQRLSIRVRQPVRQNADDRVGLAIELNRSAEHGRVRVEALSPETLRQHDDQRRFVLRFEERSKERLRAERWKHAGGRRGDANAF